MSDDLCTMCDERPATTTYGAPVCQPCKDGLVKLDAELKAEEATDPHLADLARSVEEAEAEVFPPAEPVPPRVFTTGLYRHYDGTWEAWVRRQPNAPKAAEPTVLVAGVEDVPAVMLLVPPDDDVWHFVSWTIEEAPRLDDPARVAWSKARSDAIRFTRQRAAETARRLAQFGGDLWEARWNNTLYVAEVIGAMITGRMPFDRATYEAGWNTIRCGVAA